MEDRIKGIDAGADDFISKPFNKTELLARIKSLLRMRQPSVKKEETSVLDTILSGLAEGVVVADGQWKIKNINQPARELLNIQETDPGNMDILQYLSQRNLSLSRDTLVNTQEKTTDFQILPSNASLASPLSVRMTKIFDAGGNASSITLIVGREKK